MGTSPGSTCSWYMNERSYALNSASGEFCLFPIDRNETGLPLAWWEVGLAEVGVGARKTS